MTKAAVPLMDKAVAAGGGARVINIASVAGSSPDTWKKECRHSHMW